MNPLTISRKAYTARYNIEKSMLTKKDFDAAIEKLKNGRESQKPYIKAQIVKMFKMLDIECEMSMKDDYYINKVKEMQIPDAEDIVQNILPVMFKNFSLFPTPEKYMEQIVNNANKTDNWQNDTLRLRILKQFIKYGNMLTYKATIIDENGKEKHKKVTIYQGEMYIKKYLSKKIGHLPKNNDEIIENISDDIFDVLNEDGTVSEKYELLKICDDIATGKFRVSGVTKKALYLFAIVFNMKYDVNSYHLDVETELFQNYYNNNLMRFFSNYYANNLSAVEVEPSGIGINYKNFAEMIYIYYIASDFTSIEKIKYSNEMIEALKEKSKSQEDEFHKEAATEFYRMLFTDDIIKLTKEEFVEFITKNYDRRVCFSKTARSGNTYTERISPIQLNVSQRTAYSVYSEIVTAITNLGVDISECDYGLWFADEIDLKISSKKQKSPKLAAFKKVLGGINMFLTQRAFKVKGENDVTRTAIITAYYYYYNACNMKRKREKSVSEVFKDYITGSGSLNALLEEAHYQPIDETNVFDIAVILSSFSYLYDLE